MKLEREKNAIRGTLTGMVTQFCNIFFPFIIRSIFIHVIGIEYAGLDNLFKSILQVLNLTELGVGSALVFNMYKPISDGNEIKICALMKLYKIYYRVIGIVIFGIGIAITPFLPILIKGNVPSDLNLYVLYYLNLSATVVSYWLFAHRSAVLIAHQRVDVINVITLIINIAKYALQIVSIFIVKQYYVYLTISLVFQLVQNISIAFVSNRVFPRYRPKGNIPKEERHVINVMVRDLFTAKVGGVVLTSVDTIVISSFLGLEILAIYNNYYYILTAIFSFFMVFYNACRAGIANEFITESKEKRIRDFYKLTFIVFFSMNICVSCLLNLYQPFMQIWIGDDYLLKNSSIYLLCLYFVCYEIPVFWSIYKDAVGAWHQDRFRPLIGTVVNLVFNIILVNMIGLNGVIFSTIISEVLVCIPWLLYTLKKAVMPISIGKTLLKMGIYLLCIFASSIISRLICDKVQENGILELAVKLVISVVIPIAVWCVCFWKLEECKFFFSTLKKGLEEIKR